MLNEFENVKYHFDTWWLTSLHLVTFLTRRNLSGPELRDEVMDGRHTGICSMNYKDS